MEEKKRESAFIRWFFELNSKDIVIAGGKGGILADMYNAKFPVPPGFVVTTHAYRYFIEKNNLKSLIKDLLYKVEIEDSEELIGTAEKIMELVRNASMPKEIEEAIAEAYEILDVERVRISNAQKGALDILKTGYEPPFVAVRSSATCKDLAEASFAGQHESYLNVKRKKEVIAKVKDCFSSLFTPRAIYYRAKKGFEQEDSLIAVIVQRMIDSEKSGVIFSQHPNSYKKSILIEAVWGLGDGIVSGKIKPDQYVIDVDLSNFKIIESEIADKKIAITRNSSGENSIIKLTEERSKQQVLNTYEIKRLAQYAKQLEEYYGKPQNIEFAIEGENIYITQSRPITTKAGEKKPEIKGKLLLSGNGASHGIGVGVIRIIKEKEDIVKIKKGDVLVARITTPDIVVAMQKAAGIITDEGGITSCAAIILREMGIPTVVGINEATKKLRDGEMVGIDGYNGRVYEGEVEKQDIDILPVVKTNIKIKSIVDLPEFAERAAKSGIKEIGLTKLEGIIATAGKHPLKYFKEKNIEEYIGVLFNGLKRIIMPFEEIWIRTSDIRSDEFRHLDGAPKEVEANPMLGAHGIRFGLKYLDISKAEFLAVKKIAQEFPNKKLGLMAPQIISVEELKVIKELAIEIGMPKNVKIGIIVETPAAVQIINDLCNEGIDFISININNLTQYTLAIDRNNPDVQKIYDEMNPAVLNSISYVIRRCKKYKVETNICGQAGTKEDMIKFLVSQGIDSISVNADVAHNISKLVAELENECMDNLKNKIDALEEKPKPEETVIEKAVKVSLLGLEKPAVPQMTQEVTSFLEKEEIKVPSINDKIRFDDDMENIVLKELEDNGDYLPGIEDKKRDIPSLNDAIPIEPEHAEEESKEELKADKEWRGEPRA